MLERLLIQNFQAHPKFRIDFDPGITSIVGPSDAGKSAILRALRWVCSNQPGGDAFVRHGTKGATVRLVVDGKTISRKRGAGDVNTYSIDDQEFKAFGRGVPKPVLGLLNLGPVCWQGQHDTPYWFSDTAGEVSRQLNSIVNLGIIDDTLAHCAKTLHHAKTRLEVAEECLTEAKGKHDALGWVDDFDKSLRVVEYRASLAMGARDKAVLASELVQTVLTAKERGERAAGAARAGQNMVEAGGVAIAWQSQADELAQLVASAMVCDKAAGVSVPCIEGMENAILVYTRARGASCDLLRIIDSAKACHVAAEKRVPSIKGLVDAKAVYEQATGAAYGLAHIIDNIQKLEDQLCRSEALSKKAQKALPKKCPTCGK